MPEPELALVFIRPLNRVGIRYAISGSVAAILYGEPRLTHDVDFIAFFNEPDVRQMAEIFPSSDFYVPPQETLLTEVLREQRGHFNIIHLATGYKADFYLAGRDELNAWALRGKRPVEFEGETVMLAPPEYVIVRKLEFYREGRSEKHLRDIRSMLAISGNQLNHAELSEWIQRLGLDAQWTEANA
jgi:hypothetical protein